MTRAERHTVLLKALSANLNDEKARRAYADFLQEIGNPGWFVVANYSPVRWVVVAEKGGGSAYEPKDNSTRLLASLSYADRVALPWLGVSVRSPRSNNMRGKVKTVLAAYASMNPEVRGDT